MTDIDQALEQWDAYANDSTNLSLYGITLAGPYTKAAIYQDWAHKELVKRGYAVDVSDETAIDHVSKGAEVNMEVYSSVGGYVNKSHMLQASTLLTCYLEAIKVTEATEEPNTETKAAMDELESSGGKKRSFDGVLKDIEKMESQDRDELSGITDVMRGVE